MSEIEERRGEKKKVKKIKNNLTLRSKFKI
jgi:hypothetical protein